MMYYSINIKSETEMGVGILQDKQEKILYGYERTRYTKG